MNRQEKISLDVAYYRDQLTAVQKSIDVLEGLSKSLDEPINGSQPKRRGRPPNSMRNSGHTPSENAKR
jgi:hypothetical protein